MKKLHYLTITITLFLIATAESVAQAAVLYIPQTREHYGMPWWLKGILGFAILAIVAFFNERRKGWRSVMNKSLKDAYEDVRRQNEIRRAEEEEKRKAKKQLESEMDPD